MTPSLSDSTGNPSIDDRCAPADYQDLSAMAAGPRYIAEAWPRLSPDIRRCLLEAVNMELWWQDNRPVFPEPQAEAHQDDSEDPSAGL